MRVASTTRMATRSLDIWNWRLRGSCSISATDKKKFWSKFTTRSTMSWSIWICTLTPMTYNWLTKWSGCLQTQQLTRPKFEGKSLVIRTSLMHCKRSWLVCSREVFISEKQFWQLFHSVQWPLAEESNSNRTKSSHHNHWWHLRKESKSTSSFSLYWNRSVLRTRMMRRRCSIVYRLFSFWLRTVMKPS